MQALRGPSEQRFAAEAGIAIGPILFIIAILAILAAAIAAGSGSFTSGTDKESAKTKASAIIQIGNTLKAGMDRMMMENSLSFGAYTINANNTMNNNDLFSPTGGGITVPSETMAANPGTDHWMYPTGAIPGLGTNSPEQLAFLKVTASVCDEINNRANAITTTPSVTGADLGDFSTDGTDIPIADLTNWPLPGKPIGCVNNTNSTTGGYYFYQVLYVQ